MYYDKVAEIAREVKQNLLLQVVVYSRTLDFAKFRAIADEVGLI